MTQFSTIWQREIPFGELKNQGGLAGFSTRGLDRGQLMARLIALVYDWWTPFVRLADPDHHREAIISRPLLMHDLARQTRRTGQTRFSVTSSDGRRDRVVEALSAIAGFFAALRESAQRLTQAECSSCILNHAQRKYLHDRQLCASPWLKASEIKTLG